MSELPSVKTVHKAIRNYLINELGIDRAAIDEVVRSMVQAHIQTWFTVQLNTHGSFLRKYMTDIVGQVANRYLNQQLKVAVSKVEVNAEIVIVDGRME